MQKLLLVPINENNEMLVSPIQPGSPHGELIRDAAVIIQEASMVNTANTIVCKFPSTLPPSDEWTLSPSHLSHPRSPHQTVGQPINLKNLRSTFVCTLIT